MNESEDNAKCFALSSLTPEPFQRRNVFVGGGVLDNKYELRQIYGSKPKWTVWSDEELQRLVKPKEEKDGHEAESTRNT